MFKRLGVLILAAMLCLTGCEKTETAANQFPDAPWGAPIEEIEKHYALEYRDSVDDTLHYTAQTEISNHETDLTFAFLEGNGRSHLYGVIVTVHGLSPKEAMAVYNHEKGCLLYDFLSMTEDHDPAKLPHIYHRLIESDNGEYDLYIKCNAVEIITAMIRENTDLSE